MRAKADTYNDTPKSTLDRRNKFVICFLVNKTAQFFFLIACQCPEEEIVDRKRQTDDLFKEYGGVGEERILLCKSQSMKV